MRRATPNRSPRGGSSDRGGYLYVAVLFTSLLVATLVAGALATSTSRTRRTNDRVSRIAAQQLAETELHLQLTRMQKSVDWRSSLANSQYSKWRDLLGGQVRHQFNDVDTDLADEPFDAVTLTVHARIDGAEAALSADLVSDEVPLAMLRYGLTALDDLRIDDSMHVSSELPVQVANDCLTTSGGILVTPRLEYGDVVTVAVRGNTGPSNVVGPNDNIIQRYSGESTEININSIPKTKGDHIIENVVLSSTNNPYGIIDPLGNYIIDAGNKDIIIRNCRIEGTVVIEDCKSLVLTGAIVWNSIDPARAALLCSKSITIEGMDLELSEPATDTNFNPGHTPSRGGISDATKLDRYPTSIRGIIYSLQDINLLPMSDNDRLHVAGTIIANRVNVTGRVSITSVPELITSPPLGFRDPVPLQWVHGSLRKIVSPTP